MGYIYSNYAGVSISLQQCPRKKIKMYDFIYRPLVWPFKDKFDGVRC